MAVSAMSLRGMYLVPRNEPSIVTNSEHRASMIRSESDSAEKPANYNTWKQWKYILVVKEGGIP